MALEDELKAEVANVYRTVWTKRKGYVVPHDGSMTLGNDGVEIDGTVLYADLVASTALVDGRSPEFAAEVYKTYLYCAGKIIRAEGGEITAYDGDRIMAVFIGDSKNTSAVRAALKINRAVLHVVNPALAAQYTGANYSVGSRVGVDTSALLVAKTGVRGANDLVWVGRAANHAAKLAAENGFATWVSGEVYDNMNDSVKYAGSGGASLRVDMWQQRVWVTQAGRRIHGSNYMWASL